MSVDVDKMKYLGKGHKKLKTGPKVHEDQTSFAYYDNPALEEYVNVEKQMKQENKGILEKYKGLKVDWGKIMQVEEPVFSYKVNKTDHTRYTGVLERNNSDQERKKLSKMLGLEFARVYTKYRRAIQASEGKAPSYLVHPKERRHARKAGELCFLRGIEPIVLLEYWHDNIRHFMNGIDFVPLTFCASASNVDTVINRGFAKEKESKKVHDGRGHSFCDVSQLEPMLRKKLERAGFDTTTYPDRHLLSVQRMAKNRARGKNMFVPSEMREMVAWIAETIYKNEK